MNKKEALKIINDGDTWRIEEITKILWEEIYVSLDLDFTFED